MTDDPPDFVVIDGRRVFARDGVLREHDAAWAEIQAMSREEVREELRAAGFDPNTVAADIMDRFAESTGQTVEDACRWLDGELRKDSEPISVTVEAGDLTLTGETEGLAFDLPEGEYVFGARSITAAVTGWEDASAYWDRQREVLARLCSYAAWVAVFGEEGEA